MRADRHEPLVVVELTPPGRGAIATLAVEGSDALAAVAAAFQPRGRGRLDLSCADRPVLGRFGSAPGEDVVVRVRGPECVEIHCHGGRAAVESIVRRLVRSPGAVQTWQDWLARLESDPIAAAARRALAEAPTERTAAILLDQYHGALRAALREIEERLASGDRAGAAERIESLRRRAEVGRHLTEPWSVVLAGPPNAGKSSLLNALAGYARALVHHAPGTTRDIVTVRTALDGWPVELCDTAGLHEGAEPVERLGIERAKTKLAAAELVVLVFDRSLPWRAADAALVERYPAALVVHNKSDLTAHPSPRPAGLATSALRNTGVERLAAAVVARLVPEPPAPGDAVPFLPEHLAIFDGLSRRLDGQ